MVSAPPPTPQERGPDFVGVGVQKSGSTWLGDILDQHPGVMLVERKGVHFFSKCFERGFDWYDANFEGRRGRLAGEISVNYLCTPRPDIERKEKYPNGFRRGLLRFWKKHPAAHTELAGRYPRARVFAIFRNPVDRAWSHYWYWRNRKERIGKRHQVVSFAKMFTDDGRWIRLQGEYADHLARWRSTFPEMGAFFYDDLVADPGDLTRRMYQFIGVDPDFRPITERRVKVGHYNPMPRADWELAAEHYHDQILRFSQMTGRDLSSWLEVGARVQG